MNGVGARLRSWGRYGRRRTPTVHEGREMKLAVHAVLVRVGQL
jgi:hypothetical protein